MRPAGAYSSACCLCLPRVLTLSADGKHLQQAPLPELAQLRQQQGAWHAGAAATDDGTGASSTLIPGQRLRIGDGLPVAFDSSSVDVELTVARGQADAFALLLQPFEGAAAGAAGAAVTYCWSTHTLQVRQERRWLALCNKSSQHCATVRLGWMPAGGGMLSVESPAWKLDPCAACVGCFTPVRTLSCMLPSCLGFCVDSLSLLPLSTTPPWLVFPLCPYCFRCVPGGLLHRSGRPGACGSRAPRAPRPLQAARPRPRPAGSAAGGGRSARRAALLRRAPAAPRRDQAISGHIRGHVSSEW